MTMLLVGRIKELPVVRFGAKKGDTHFDAILRLVTHTAVPTHLLCQKSLKLNTAKRRAQTHGLAAKGFYLVVHLDSEREQYCRFG